jgi:Domain of unknown function (DUF4376)
MQKFQDSKTGQEWHFDDEVDVSILSNIPPTLTSTILPRSSFSHDWIDGAWVENLPTAQAAQMASLKAAYLVAIHVPVAYMGTTFQADDVSQALLTNALAAGSVPAEFAWLDINNTPVLMNYAQLQGLAGAMLVQTQSAFAKFQELKAKVRTAVTTDEILAVVW